jgi:regulator of replication initiation timing
MGERTEAVKTRIEELEQIESNLRRDLAVLQTRCANLEHDNEQLEARLKRLSKYNEGSEDVQGFIDDLLERLEKRGINTQDWDGDESCAILVVRGLMSHFDERVESILQERDQSRTDLAAIKKENDRLEKENAVLRKYRDSQVSAWEQSVKDNPPKRVC